MRKTVFLLVLFILIASNGFLMIRNNHLQKENRRMRVFSGREEEEEEKGQAAELLEKLLREEEKGGAGIAEILVTDGELRVRTVAEDLKKLQEQEEKISDLVGRSLLRTDLEMRGESVYAALHYGGVR